MLINRYIFISLIEVLGGTLAVLYGVMLIVQWISFGTAISLGDFDVLLLSMVPMTAFVLPMGLLFSILLVLEKLSVESEIIAMKACGVRSATIFAPVIILSIMAMLVHMMISTTIGPLAMKTVQARLMQTASQKIFSFLKEREFDESFKGLVVYVESVNPRNRELKNVFIETSGGERSVITSEKGTIEAQKNSIVMKLKNGSVFMNSKLAEQYLTFDEYRFALSINVSEELRIKSYETATMGEFRKLLEKSSNPKKIKEYYNRYAFPFLNLLLGLVGISFGIVRPRSPRFTGFMLGLGTIIGYYFLFTLADRMVRGGVMDPMLGAWFPDILFFLILCTILAIRKLHFGGGGA